MTKLCPHCKQEFIPKRKNQVYCSEKCRKLAYKKRKYFRENAVLKVCPVCSKEFLAYKRKKYCSDSCKNKALKQRFIERHGKDYFKKQIDSWKEQHKDKIKKYRQKWCKDPETKEKKRLKFKLNNEITKEESIKQGKYYAEWTDEEVEFLLENWDKMTKKEIAKALNRTLAAVHGIANICLFQIASSTAKHKK